MSKVIEKISLATAGTGAMMLAGSKLLAAYGFGQAGIIAASKAAIAQAAVGNLASGSTISILQSAGAKGIIAIVGANGLILICAGGTLYGGYKIYKYYKH